MHSARRVPRDSDLEIETIIYFKANRLARNLLSKTYDFRLGTYINYPARFVGTGGIRRERVPAGDVFQRVVVDRHRSRSFRRHRIADARPARRFRRENRAAQSGPDRRGVQVASE